ncbi:MAG: hypothetical protein FD180_3927 [Planctomycetota bacterium]|nr:MAG: hypothetical protein FD180_3927 [Planctomycetota bacterium]
MSGLLFGTAGWSFADWAGKFYPTAASKKPLEFYSDYFECAEVNVTFYRPPEVKLSAGWVKKVDGKKFIFAVKVSQEFTHEPAARVGAASSEPVWGAAEAKKFLEGIAPIEAAGRLGPLLLQFPWSFRNTPEARERIARLGDAFAPKQVVVELRHASWERPEVVEWMRERGIGYVNIDQPAERDCLGPSEHVTSDVAYVRLHGRNVEKWFAKDIEPHERYDYWYPEKELDPWAERIKRMMARSKALFVIGNNHYRGKAPANALQLKAKVTGKKVRVPEPLVVAFPVLKGIAEKEKGTLF